jgi:hypothetical protein
MGELIIYLLGATITLGAILYVANKVAETKQVKEVLDRI